MPKVRGVATNSYLQNVFATEDATNLFRAYLKPEPRRRASSPPWVPEAAGQPKDDGRTNNRRLEGRTLAPSSLNLRDGYHSITDYDRKQSRRRSDVAASVDHYAIATERELREELEQSYYHPKGRVLEFLDEHGNGVAFDGDPKQVIVEWPSRHKNGKPFREVVESEKVSVIEVSGSHRRLGTPLSYATGRPTYCEHERDAAGRITGRAKEVPSVAGRNSPSIGFNWLQLPWCSITDYPSAFHACFAMIASQQEALIPLLSLNINSMYDLAKILIESAVDLGLTEDDLMFCTPPEMNEGNLEQSREKRRTVNEILRFASYRGAVFVELQTKTPLIYTVVLVCGSHGASGNIVYLDPQRRGTEVDYLQARLGDIDRRRAPGGSTIFVDLPERLRLGPGMLCPEPDRM